MEDNKPKTAHEYIESIPYKYRMKLKPYVAKEGEPFDSFTDFLASVHAHSIIKQINGEGEALSLTLLSALAMSEREGILSDYKHTEDKLIDKYNELIRTQSDVVRFRISEN